MSRILLVDDSPHAQRMGERILSDEGYEVVTVSNADSALIRLEDVDPDLVIADTVMPGRTGFDICQFLKMSPRHKYVRVILTAGILEPLDEEQIKRVEADGTLKKPFEASALLAAVKPLLEGAAADRAVVASGGTPVRTPSPPNPASAPFVAVIDAEQIRAAVTLALDASMGTMVDEITQQVMTLLKKTRSSETPVQHAPAQPDVPRPAAPQAAEPKVETVRRVTPVRFRSGSILGLDIGRDPESID